MAGLGALEADLEAAARSWWPRVRRFAGGFVFAFISALAASGTSQWTFSSLVGLAGGAAMTALGETFPSIPFRKAYELIHKHAVAVDPPQTTAPQAALRTVPHDPPGA